VGKDPYFMRHPMLLPNEPGSFCKKTLKCCAKRALHIALYIIHKRALHAAKKALYVLQKNMLLKRALHNPQTSPTYFAKELYIL